MYNAYVKGELYEIDLWAKLKKNHKNELVFQRNN